MLLLQEFDFEVKDRIGTENQVVDHLSRLEDEAMWELGEKTKIDDTFPDEHVLAASHDLIPWFPDFANYLDSDIVPSDLYFHHRKIPWIIWKFSFGMSLIYINVVLMGLFTVVSEFEKLSVF